MERSSWVDVEENRGLLWYVLDIASKIVNRPLDKSLGVSFLLGFLDFEFCPAETSSDPLGSPFLGC